MSKLKDKKAKLKVKKPRDYNALSAKSRKAGGPIKSKKEKIDLFEPHVWESDRREDEDYLDIDDIAGHRD